MTPERGCDKRQRGQRGQSACSGKPSKSDRSPENIEAAVGGDPGGHAQRMQGVHHTQGGAQGSTGNALRHKNSVTDRGTQIFRGLAH